MRKYLILCLLSLFCTTLLAQKKKKAREQDAQELLNQLEIDSASFMKSATEGACKCIDSVDKAVKPKKEKMAAFADCIKVQVAAYQLSLKMLAAMKAGGNNHNITLSLDEEGSEYKKSYYEIERSLNDNCPVLRTAMSLNNDVKENSFSSNEDANAAYESGLKYLQKEDYAGAIPWFEKAVAIDPKFVFAWDNLGVSYRRTGRLDEALSAYQSALKVDPTAKTPLQNLPVVYLLQKKSAEAIAAYKNILVHYPDDPEAFYGVAVVYLENEKDYEQALQYMCKAYNLYVEQKSPYRTDAEKVINTVYAQMKKDGKEETFWKILKENNIKSN